LSKNHAKLFKQYHITKKTINGLLMVFI